MDSVIDAVSQFQASTGGFGTALVGGGVALASAALLLRGNPAQKDVPNMADLGKSSLEGKEYTTQVGDVQKFFSQSGGSGVSGNRNDTPEMVQKFYNLVTDMYEWGWGQSFHFATRRRGQGLQDSIRRHEERLSDAIGLGPGKKAVDCGCGVGGPMRNIARYSGGNVTGISICAYQIKRGKMHNERSGLAGQCEVVHGNFLDMPFDAQSFDCAYAIEATCHAPDLTQVYGEVFRVLKPGSLFGTYEWLVTDKYDPNNKRHVEIVDGINYANGLPDMRNIQQALDALRAVGFEIISEQDLAPSSEVPWYYDLKAGKWLHKARDMAIGVLERLHIAPKGTYDVHAMLTQTAKDLVAGGETGIFTPMHLIVARKPL